METEDQVRLCEELEFLFAHTEGLLSLDEYQACIQQLQQERESILKRSGMLAE